MTSHENQEYRLPFWLNQLSLPVNCPYLSLLKAISCFIFFLFSVSGRSSPFEVWKSGMLVESCEVKFLADNPLVWLFGSRLITSLLESLTLGSGQWRESGCNVGSSEKLLESWEVRELPDLLEQTTSVGHAWRKPVCFFVTLVVFGLCISGLLVEACEVELLPWRSREPGTGGMDKTSPFLELEIQKLCWNPVKSDLSSTSFFSWRFSVEVDAKYCKVQTQSVFPIQRRDDYLICTFLKFSCYADLRDCVTRSIHRLSFELPMDICEDTDMHWSRIHSLDSNREGRPGAGYKPQYFW